MVKKLTLKDSTYPERLRNIPSPPKELYFMGESMQELLRQPAVSIVGSRKVTAYGRSVTEKLAFELAGQGVVVISGLALGVDGLAHKAALEAGGATIAVLPCGLDRIYPASHYHLAKQIIKQGGAIMSEYPERTDARKENFIARNRIVSGLSDGLLITEAAEKSGTLHTANFALEQGREVMVVPGNITSPQSVGTNNLLKAGAVPVTQTNDILRTLELEPVGLTEKQFIAENQQEHILLQLMKAGHTESDLLLAHSRLDLAVFNQTLTMLEISGKIKSLGGNNWTLA